MTTIVGTFACFLVFYSCNDSFFPGPNGTFFKGSIDETRVEGNGVVFLDEQGRAELIRLIAGNEIFYQEINISIDDATSGTHNIIMDQASVTEVHGLDAVSKICSSNGDSDDFVTFRHVENFIEGEFSFAASATSATSIYTSAHGRFRVEASSSRDWNCNFEDGFVTYCYFLE